MKGSSLKCTPKWGELERALSNSRQTGMSWDGVGYPGRGRVPRIAWLSAEIGKAKDLPQRTRRNTEEIRKPTPIWDDLGEPGRGYRGLRRSRSFDSRLRLRKTRLPGSPISPLAHDDGLKRGDFAPRGF